MKDQLDQVKNLFYVGAYQSVLTNLTSPSSLDPQKSQLCQVYKIRAQIALGNNALTPGDLAQLPGDTVRLLKFQEQVNNAQLANNLDFDQLYVELKSINVGNALVAALIAELYLGALDKAGDAFEILVPFIGEDLECGCLLAQCLLRLNRVDLAERQVLSAMKQLAGDFDIDLPIIQITEASIMVSKGREGYQDAFYIYQELLETFGMTSKLLTCQAVT